MSKNPMSYVKPIKPGTAEAEHLIGSGYRGMTVKRAEQIIAERAKDPHTWPLERVEEAEAFLAAYKTPAQVISKRPGWKRPTG